VSSPGVDAAHASPIVHGIGEVDPTLGTPDRSPSLQDFHSDMSLAAAQQLVDL
jgi:hypothetical protein